MSPGVESLDSRSSASGASSDSRLPTPTSFPQRFLPAPPLENPFLVPAQVPVQGLSTTKSHHRKSQSRGSVHSIHSINGSNVSTTLKPPMTDQQPKRKRSRTASAHQSQYGDLMSPTIPQDSWRTHQSLPIRPPPYDSTSISHLNPQMLESPFPPNYDSTPGGGKLHSSPPSTPPSAFRRRRISGSGEEGADLLLYLATSPSPAQPSSRRLTSNLVPPGTPPMIRKSAAVEPATPSQSTFDVRDYINITPSPAPAIWNGGTPMTVGTPARRRLTYDDAVVGSPVELGNDGVR
jgi:hypothetical protein